MDDNLLVWSYNDIQSLLFEKFLNSHSYLRFGFKALSF